MALSFYRFTASRFTGKAEEGLLSMGQSPSSIFHIALPFSGLERQAVGNKATDAQPSGM